MPKTITRLTAAAAGLTAATCLYAPAAHAFGDAPWCMVKNLGSDVVWDCQYRSAAECAPNVIAGDRSFCNLNPWPGPPAAETKPEPVKPRSPPH